MVNRKAWYVRHGSKPEFIHWDGQRAFDECLYISDVPSIAVLYNIDKESPNEYVKQFGYIFSNLPGDMILVYENKDVPENIEELLPAILQKDNDARGAFFNYMQAQGIEVIQI
jgi:hypothetical protein